jgi:hypothetical protein
MASNWYVYPPPGTALPTYYPPWQAPTAPRTPEGLQKAAEAELEESTAAIDRVLRFLADSPDPNVRRNARTALAGIDETLEGLQREHRAQLDELREERDAAMRQVREAQNTRQASLMGERTLSCETCRRVFCRVEAPVEAVITPRCEGCIREGRAP